MDKLLVSFKENIWLLNGGGKFTSDLSDQIPNLVFIVVTLWKNITRNNQTKRVILFKKNK